MRKNLLSLIAMAVMAFSANAMYLIGAPAGNWSPAIGIEMTAVSGGWEWSGTVGAEEYFAFATQLGEENDWGTFNANYRLSPAYDGAEAGAGVYPLHLGAPEGALHGIGKECTYFVSEVNGAYKLTVTVNGEEAPVPDTPMYLIGSPAGNWSPAVGIEMNAVSGGWVWSGTVGVEEYFAFATQLGEENDWDTFNANYRLSPVNNGLPAAPGEYVLHLGTPEGALHGIGKECTYFIREENGNYSLTVTVNGSEQEKKWYIIGEYNEWSLETCQELTEISYGVWSITLPELNGEFKFCADRSLDFNYGGDFIIYYDDVYIISENGSPITIENAKDVTLILDLLSNTLTVEGYKSTPEELALRGSFSSWAWTPAYQFEETEVTGVYTLSVASIEAGAEFKIANYDWSEQYTSEILDMEANIEYDVVVNVGGSSNMGIKYDYTDVVFILDTNNNTLTFRDKGPNSGISTITIEKDAEYYNLQGVRVSMPDKGFYIRIVNGKAEKVLLK